MVTDARNPLTTIAVTLDWSECLLAGWVALIRQINVLQCQRQNVNGDKDPGRAWDDEINGAAAEAAVSKGLQRPWIGMGGYQTAPADVEGLQVRWTAAHSNRLIVQVKDRGADVFVFVTGRIPTFTLRGWVSGDEAKQRKYWDDPGTGRPAWFVAVADLHDIGSLTPWAG